MEDKPTCNWKLDADGHADIRVLFDGADCKFPPGFKGWVSSVAEVAPSSPTPETRATVAPRPHRKKETHMPPVAPSYVPEAAEVAAPAPLTATVAAPPVPSADDLSRIAANAGGGMNGIIMALIAVVGGGGAVWKYLQSKQKASAKKDELAHEQRMKELELQADNQKRDDDKHGECKAARDSLATKLLALDERVTSLSFNVRELQTKLTEMHASLEQIQLGVNRFKASSFDPEEIIERLDALEEEKPKKRAVRR